MINGIIEWCNDNQGFMAAILSVCSLIVSITAIMISILVANIPYRKKLAIWSYNDYENRDLQTYKVNIYILNVGNRGMRIKKASVFWNGISLGHTVLENTERQYLQPTDQMTLIVKCPIKEYKINLKDRMTIIIEDVEGKKYTIRNRFAVG